MNLLRLCQLFVTPQVAFHGFVKELNYLLLVVMVITRIKHVVVVVCCVLVAASI